MVRYNVWFSINGVQYFTVGTGTYPTLQELADGSYNERLAQDAARMFVSGYMDVMKMTGKVDSGSLSFTMEPDNS